MGTGHAPPPSHASEAFGVLLDDALGILLVAPAIFLLRHRRSIGPQLRAENPLAALTVLLVLAGVTLSVYSGMLESRFGFRHATLVVLPPAVWLALQHGLPYTVAGNLLVYFITTLGTAMGYGPFNDHTSGLPMLLAIYTLTTLLVAGGRAERRTAEERIRHLATRDLLTDLPNRGLLATRLDLALSSARRQERSVAVLFIDLDHFKQINDSLGHDAGDAVLGIAAERITACLRAGSTVARFGGDEFIALVEWLTGPEGASHAAQRIAHSLAQPFELENRRITLSCSIGVSLFPHDAQSGPDLIKCADVAMYEAKKAGRNTFRFHSSQPGLLAQHAR